MPNLITEQVTEREFQDQVIELARLYGWRVHHTRPARTSKGWRTPVQGQVGFPDLVLVRAPRVVVAELKREKGKLSAEQEGWGAALLRCPGVEYFIWRPSDFEAIEEALR